MDRIVTIADTTSKKAAEEILVEVKRVLDILKVNYKVHSEIISRFCQDVLLMIHLSFRRDRLLSLSSAPRMARASLFALAAKLSTWYVPSSVSSVPPPF